MIYLFLSILASVAVSVLLKIARGGKIDIAQAVAVNYIVAITLILVLFPTRFSEIDAYVSQWRLFTALGILLPGVFLILGQAVRKAGIVKADAAQRLSLFIAIIAAFTLFGDTITAVKAIGIALALLALVLLVVQSGNGSHGGWLWILAVWLGYGVIDVLFKQLSKTGLAFTNYLLISFVIAAVFMFTYLFLRRTRLTLPSVLGGMVLGALNFTNIYTYVRAHQVLHDQTALVFTTMNIGVITLSTIVGAAIFHEKLGKGNLLGIVMAIIAIAVLFNGARWSGR